MERDWTAAFDRVFSTPASQVEAPSGSHVSSKLPSRYDADAVMSVDALIFTPDKQAAAAELFRVIRPGGRLVLTSFAYRVFVVATRRCPL